MNVTVKPGLLSGAVATIPSKSDAHRLLIAAALADKPTHIALPSRSRDIDATADCLRALGADIQDEPGGVVITPIIKRGEAIQLDCGESGTTLRLLLPVAAALCKRARLIGRGRLPERPLAELIRCLSAHGVCFDHDRLPLSLSGELRAGEYSIPGDVSSQYISGLLLALPLLAGDSSIRLTSPLESAGYVDMTLSALSRFGVIAQTKPGGFFVPGKQAYRSPGCVRAEGDWSNAAFFLAAGAIGKPVTCTGPDAASAQPDRVILELLGRFGADVTWRDGAVTVSPAPLTGMDIDVSQSPDLVPILAVLGCAAAGQTRLYNARRLRMKESDRLSAVAAMLRAFGAAVEELPDELVITGGALSGGSVDCCEDHRIAMAAAVAATIAAGETTLTGTECVEKSYPSFFEDFVSLGGSTDVVQFR
ncbi:MAG: 3-phosphoshikimate 1-carboxyvinyltransferase [Bacillota bacterium]